MIKQLNIFLIFVLLHSVHALFAQDATTRFINEITECTMNEFAVNHENPGLTKSAGYDYPDENTGKIVYPAAEDYYLFSPIARTENDDWILIFSSRFKSPVWIETGEAWPLENDYDVPIFKALPEVGITIPQEVMKSKKSIHGVYTSPCGDAYSMPRSYSDNVACHIPEGKKVIAVAMLEHGLDVLVKTGVCKDYVWIWKIDAEWENNRDWFSLDLPIIKPVLNEKPELPEIKYIAREKIDVCTQKKGDPLTVFIRNTHGEMHDWQKKLPAKWKPKDNVQAELFVTIRKIPDMIEVCHYIPYGAFARIRLDYALFLTLDDPKKLIAKTIIKGNIPALCPSSKKSDDPSKCIGKPEFTECIQWLEPYVLNK
jgi:hypothetical protein